MDSSASNEVDVRVKLHTDESSLPKNEVSEESDKKSLSMFSHSNMAIRKEGQPPSNVKKDLNKIVLLVYLYFLQGIPLGNYSVFITFVNHLQGQMTKI